MNKILLTLSLTFLCSQAMASDCQVSGISDSPQSITCSYKDGWTHHMKLNIRCENGKYIYSETANGTDVGGGNVTSTFHMDVSSGSSPLGFVLDDSRKLIITHQFARFFRGEFMWEQSGSGSNHTFRCSAQ